jgi:hypothetical protein
MRLPDMIDMLDDVLDGGVGGAAGVDQEAGEKVHHHNSTLEKKVVITIPP